VNDDVLVASAGFAVDLVEEVMVARVDLVVEGPNTDDKKEL
jgi:hypothetical protein